MNWLKLIFSKYISILFLFIINSKCVNSNEVLGCGGYVKSQVEINYAQVKIKLLTQHGNQKYETECAPNNGYYFIPLYDKGVYVLKVYPPSGWTFEPEEVNLKIDGESDPCSLNQDINFHFKGFAVIGKVISIGSDTGPAGMAVTLSEKGKIIAKAITTKGGNYVFTPLASGTYDVEASHESWTLLKSKTSVIVTDQNGDAGSSLIVGGYTLNGNIDAEGTIAKNVVFVLHSKLNLSHKLGCIKGYPHGYKNARNIPVLCYTPADNRGNFKFSNISPGTYEVTPYFTSSSMKYDIEPHFVSVKMNHEDQQIQETFKLKGCNLHGNVYMNGKTGAIKGAEIELDGKLKTVSDAQGSFVFENVKFGKHTLKTIAEDVEFDTIETILSVENTKGLHIHPTKFKTCFSVSVDSTTEKNVPWTIEVKSSKEKFDLQTSSQGHGCVFLPASRYSAFVALTSTDEEAGIRFGPEDYSFEVGVKPNPLMTFSQFLGEIQGTIQCFESCKIMSICLRPTKSNTITPRTIASNQGKFIFKEVVPGDYLLTIDKEEWCWKEQTITVSVNAKSVPAKFEQTGYRLTMLASHATKLNYVTQNGLSGTIEAQQGTSRECVSAPGKYAFTPSGCHRFENSPLTWDTSSPQLITLTATHHKVTGVVVSQEDGPFTILAKSKEGEEVSTGPLSSSDKQNYRFEHWMAQGETLDFIPTSQSNLFQYSPSHFELQVEDDCLFNFVEFKAERALFLKGNVVPALKGVSITVKGSNKKEALSFTTNADGVFIAGPLDKSFDYTVFAEKLGYTISPPSHQVAKGNTLIKLTFDAYKLAEINVKIVDDKNEPLSGVLVSTSGGKDYKQNSLTEADGSISFLSLMPSDYFIRPMMKEYTFNPASRMVKVEGGATVNVQISGSRVAYSIFGQTVSLNGDSEGDVVVEAIGIADLCLGLQEEALADQNGNFRIRGLLPKCNYKISLKKGEGINQHVARSLPKEKLIEMDANDHKNLKVIVLRPFLQMDVSIFVETEHKFLNSLSAELYRDDAPDNPVQVMPVGNHPFFMLPPMIQDQKDYTIQLKSSLSSNQYDIAKTFVSFKANSSFIKLEVDFKPTFKSVDAEISRGTVMAVFSFMVLVGLVLNYQKFMPLVNSAASLYSSSSNPKKSARQIDSGGYSSELYISSNVKQRVKSRKT